MRWGAKVVALCAVAFTVAGCSTPQTPQPANADPVPVAAPGSTAVFIGDSYTAGFFATRPEQRWSTIVARTIGVFEVNLGRPGTGYTTSVPAGICMYDSCPAFAAVIPLTERMDPDYVFVSGGLNDNLTTPAAEDAEASAISDFFQSLRAAVPDAEIIALGPNYVGPHPAPTDRQNIAVRDAADAVDGVYIDMLNPNVLTTEGVYEDRTHPNDVGHAAIAARVLEGMSNSG